VSFDLACMLCGAAGGRQLFLTILAIFAFMFFGSLALLVGQILHGDWADVASRERPLEAEREAARMEGGRG
jgi:hypothetical protein